jgi:uncharacterized protein (UPF0210 family)
MKIRSITTFTNPGWPIVESNLQQAADFISAARPAFEAAGYEVQTARLATPPFPNLLPDCKPENVVEFAQSLEAAVSPIGFDYLAIGPALPEIPESYQAIPDVIAATKNVFASGIMADPRNGVSLPAVRACAEVIQRLGPMDENGFANLYFAALANVPPGAPFFPAAYHDGEMPAFAIATEAADLAVKAFTDAGSLDVARHNLTKALETHAHQIIEVVDELTHRFDIRFGGIDYSLAPFPEIDRSLGTAMERLGVPKVGLHGSLAAAAIIADTIDKANFPHVGFSGMMLPVLEDATLAVRASEGTLTVKDLLLYSAVCGTGLDTVPLPGDVTVEAVTAVLLDLSALAIRLGKPLTARLMPIPGKKAGDPTGFDFAYFANSRVMRLDAETLNGVLAGDEAFDLKPRNF